MTGLLSLYDRSSSDLCWLELNEEKSDPSNDANIIAKQVVEEDRRRLKAFQEREKMENNLGIERSHCQSSFSSARFEIRNNSISEILFSLFCSGTERRELLETKKANSSKNADSEMIVMGQSSRESTQANLVKAPVLKHRDVYANCTGNTLRGTAVSSDLLDLQSSTLRNRRHETVEKAYES